MQRMVNTGCNTDCSQGAGWQRGGRASNKRRCTRILDVLSDAACHARWRSARGGSRCRGAPRQLVVQKGPHCKAHPFIRLAGIMPRGAPRTSAFRKGSLSACLPAHGRGLRGAGTWRDDGLSRRSEERICTDGTVTSSSQPPANRFATTYILPSSSLYC